MPSLPPNTELRIRLRAAMKSQGLSIGELARAANFDRSYISHILAGRRNPSPEAITNLDTALGGGVLPLGPVSSDETLYMIDIIDQVGRTDVSTDTIDHLADAVDRLCRAYPTMPGPELRDRSKRLMDYALKLLDRRTTLTQYRELLVQVGWLACLLGCVHYDVLDRLAADTARRAALTLGEQAGHGEIIGWSFEIQAWFALTEHRWEDVIAASAAGCGRAGVTSAGVQLVLQEAKARALMGDDRAHEAIQRGRRILDQLPSPEHPENHFIFDPAKWEFYAATIYTLIGWDEVAMEHIEEVVRQCEHPGGNRWPMRLADTRINHAMIAGRNGNLDEAVAVGQLAFEFERRSGSMLSRAKDLLGELDARYPGEALVQEYRDRLSAEMAL